LNTHIVSAESPHDFSGAIELDFDALVEILFPILSVRARKNKKEADLFEFRLGLRHGGRMCAGCGGCAAVCDGMETLDAVRK
jgi:ferredoxin